MHTIRLHTLTVILVEWNQGGVSLRTAGTITQDLGLEVHIFLKKNY